MKLEVDLDPDAGCVNIDPLQMEQVLINLALNARDAMADQGGTLSIATRRVTGGTAGDEQDAAEIRVSDSGCGMSGEVRSRAFEPFFTTKERGAGTGLGLAMVHGIVTQIGGTIGIDSTPGRGTTIAVSLPRIDPSPAAESVQAAAGRDEGTLAGTRVLVVDDEGGVRDIVARTLVNRGCVVGTAGSAEQALPIALGEAWDLVLSDVVMPGMSGVQLVHRLREEGFASPVLLMSGHAADKIAESDRTSTPILQKPFRTEQLVGAVEQALATGEGNALSTPPAPPGGAVSALRILVVDDHPLVLKLTAALLGRLGHDCLTCDDPGHVPALLEEHHHDLDVVITDYSMPGLSGADIVALCRRDYPGLVTMVASGYLDDEIRALTAGNVPDATLPKPLTEEAVRSALAGVERRARRTRTA